MRRLITILFLSILLLPLTAAAAPLPPYIIVTDSGENVPVVSDNDLLSKGVTVRFRVNSSMIATDDAGFRELRNALKNIPKGYKFCRLLVLRGSASPEGPAENNKRLAHRRARVLVDSLRHYVTLPDSTVEERYVNEDYAGLYTLIEHSNMPYKDEVLSEIGYSDDDAVIKKRLQEIAGGRAWRILLRDYFPKLRATRVIMVVTKEIPPVKKEELKDTITATDTVITVTDTIPLPVPTPDTVAVPAAITQEPAEVFKPWIAVKTNLIYDAALTPNFEIERWFGRNNRWSIMAEWNFPWWQWHHKERVYEVNELGLEFRRWLHKKPRWWLTGHFIALYLAGGYYDLEWRYHGEQGDFYSAGLTYGYAVKLSRHWNMELSASVGFIHSPYTHYEAEHKDNILFAKYKKDFNYFGPTKLKVSIVWLIGKTKRR